MTRLWARKAIRIGSLVALVLAVAAAASVGTYALTRPSVEADPSTAAPTTTSTTVAAAAATIRQTISVSGTLTPAVQESVNFAVSGTVSSVDVKAGQKAKKGQVLAAVGTLALDSDVASAKAALASAKARLVSDGNGLSTQQSTLSTAQGNLTTAQGDGDSATVTAVTSQISTLQAQITSTKAQITADRSAITVAEGQVTTAEQNRKAATLRAPVAGLVTTVAVAPGDAVTGSGSSNGAASGGGSGSGSGGSGSGSGGSGGFAGGGSGGGSQGSASSGSSSAAFVIVNTSQWQVNASVSDSQVGLLQVGDQVQISTDTGGTGGTGGTDGTGAAGRFPGAGGFGGFGTAGGFGGFGASGGAGGAGARTNTGGARNGAGGTGSNNSGSNGTGSDASGSGQRGAGDATPMLFGTVSSIGLVSTGSGSTASYPVVVDVTDAQAALHDGTSVTAQIIYRQLTGVLTVPTAAITTSGGTSTVTVVSGSTHTKRAVTTGASSGPLTQITSGLAEGDEVLVTTIVRAGTGTGTGTGTGNGTGARPTAQGRNGSGRNGRDGSARNGGNPAGGGN